MNPNAPEADLRLKIEIILLNPKGYRDDTAEILALIADTLNDCLPEKKSEEYKSWIDGMMDKRESYKNNGMTVQNHKGYNQAIDETRENLKKKLEG